MAVRSPKTASNFAILTFLLFASLSIANPLPRVLLTNDFPSNLSLELRQACGGTWCGYYGNVCCDAGSACATISQLATCTPAAATAAAVTGGVQVITTTYTDFETITTTYGVGVGSSPTSSPGGTCNANLGQSQCGTQCCTQDEWCDGSQCRGYGGSSSGAPAATVVGGSTISNFIAPTSVGVATITSSMSITTTIPFQTPVGSSGSVVTGQMVSSNNGLSPGAIAGIVIGVLLGLLILFLILACLCCRSIFDSIFGRKKRKETTTYIETHHSHHGGSGGAPPRRRWFGVLPARADRPPKKSSGLGGLLGVAGVLGALAVVLGLKRRSKKPVDEKTEYTTSDYTYSYDDYTTSASEYSSQNDYDDLS